MIGPLADMLEEAGNLKYRGLRLLSEGYIVNRGAKVAIDEYARMGEARLIIKCTLIACRWCSARLDEKEST